MRRLILLCAISLTGCASGDDKGKCEGRDDCPSGQICVAGECRKVCVQDWHCEAGSCCVDGVCGTCETTGDLPVIVAIDGTGSADDDPTHAARHLENHLVITGRHLADSLATLKPVAPGAESVTLPPCGTPTDTELELALPDSIADGEYVLTLSNQAGSCRSEVHLLQGEPGSWDDAPASLIETINDATAADASLALRGTIAGDRVTTLFLRGSLTPAEQTILMEGSEQVDDHSEGLYLLIFDTVTNTIYDEVVGNFYRTRDAFPADNSLDSYNGLRQALEKVRDEPADPKSFLVILVSAGDISPMMTDGPLVSILKEFGASGSIDQLAADSGYALVGSPFLGEARGLEQVVGPARDSRAVVATVVVDGSLLGDDGGMAGLGSVSSAAIIDGSISSVDIEDGSLDGDDLVADLSVGTSLEVGAAFRVTGDGRVGIGSTDAAGFVLNVDGTSHFSGDIAADGALVLGAHSLYTGSIDLGDATAGELYKVGEILVTAWQDWCDLSGETQVSGRATATAKPARDIDHASFALWLDQRDFVGIEPEIVFSYDVAPSPAQLQLHLLELEASPPSVRVGLYEEVGVDGPARLDFAIQAVCSPTASFTPATVAEDLSAVTPVGDFNGQADLGQRKWALMNTLVGIGVAEPSYILEVAGDARSTGTFIDGSSRSYKKEIQPLALEAALDALAELSPVTYKQIRDDRDPRVGFIAEDVPELLATAERKGLSALEIVAVLTKVVQDQDERLNEQAAQNRALERRLSRLERDLALRGSE